MTLQNQGENLYANLLSDKGNDFTASTSIFKYSQILDIPFSYKVVDSLGKYFAKVNSSIAGFPIIGYIFSIFFCFQIIGPALLINATDIWPSNSVLTQISRILCWFCDGPSIQNADQRLYMSLVLSLLYLISFLSISIRSYYFTKLQILTSAEAVFSYVYFKYVLVIFLPLLLSGFPRAIYKVSNSEDIGLSISIIILVLFSYFISISVMVFFIFPRVLLENVPVHGWISVLTFLPYLSTQISTILSSSISFITGYKRLCIPALIFLIYAFIGLVTISGNIYIKSKYSIFFASIEFSASMISLFQILHICFQQITPEIIIIILALFIVIFYILLTFYNKKIATATIQFYDENVKPSNLRSVLDSHYSSKRQFIAEMLLMIEYWHPLLSSWKLFDYAIVRWPRSYVIHLLYSRLLSLYPTQNKIMVYVSSQKNDSLFSAVAKQLARQFNHISQSRQTSLTKKINSKMKRIDSRIHILFSHLRKFWTNILQKNISGFWDDAVKADTQIRQIDSMLMQLTKDHPNNSDVWRKYREFLINIKHDLKAASEIKNKISILEHTGRQQPDQALKLALHIFPNIQPSLQDCRDISNDSQSGQDEIVQTSLDQNYMKLNYEDGQTDSPETNKISTQETDLHVEIAAQELIQHTKLGSSLLSSIFCVIMTLVLIAVFIIYSNKYGLTLVNRQNAILALMNSFCLFYYNLANFNLLFMTLPLFESNIIKVDRSFMDSIAPNLYTSAKLIPQWRVDRDLIESIIIDARKYYSSTIQDIYKLDDSADIVGEIINLIDYDIVYEGNNLQTTVEQILTTIESSFILPAREFYDRLNDINFYDILNATYSQLDKIYNLTVAYSLTNYDNSLNEINQYIVLTLIIALFFITLPFVLKLFKLTLQGEAISKSFLYFPNNENRRIITKYGEESSFDTDSSYLAILAKKTSVRPIHSIQLAIVFLFSFVPAIFGCFSIKYLAKDFVSDADFTTISLSTLHMPFTFLILSMESVLRISISNTINTFPYSNVDNYNDSIYQNSLRYLDSSNSYFSNGMWGRVCSIVLYLTRDDKNGTINSYSNFFKQRTNVRPKTLFEVLATNEFPYSIDLVISSLQNIIADHNPRLDIEQTNDPEFLSLLFWFTNFSSINRNMPYFDLVESNANLYLNKYKQNAIEIIGIVGSLQLISCLMIIWMYNDRSKRIKNALRFYQDVSFANLMQNHNAINLLNTGKEVNDRLSTQFTDSKWIVDNMPQCVFVADRDLVITDYNRAFYDFVQSHFNNSPIEIRNSPLTEVIHVMNATESDLVSVKGEYSWRVFVQHLAEVFSGRKDPQFSEPVTLTISDETVLHILVNAIGLSEESPVRENDGRTIESIAVVIENVTKEYQSLLQLHQDSENLNKMLYRVLPEHAVKSLFNSTEGTFSFYSQDVIIGMISIDHITSSDPNTISHCDIIENLFYIKEINIVEIDKTLKTYNDIFSKLDEIINQPQFNSLLKIKTIGNVYMFGAGFYDNLEDKVGASQACAFALKVLRDLESYVKTVTPEMIIRCGIHSDGPLVSGIVSFTNPFIQVVSPALDRVSKLLMSSDPFRVRISRNVYNSIFTYSGFSVIEKNYIEMPDSTKIQVFELGQREELD